MKLIAFTKWIYDRPIDEMAEIVAGAGFDGVDLPVREKAGIPAEVALETLSQARETFADHGLTIERLVTDITAPRPGLDELLEAFRGAGVTKIRLGGKPLKPTSGAREAFDAHRRDLESLEPVLARHGIHGAVQVHSGDTAHATAGLCLRCVEGRDPAVLGVQIDTGHLMVAGESPELAVALAGPYLHSVNLKAIRLQSVADPKSGRPTFAKTVVPLRDGSVDWESLLRAVVAAGYEDALSIHPEYRSPYYRYEENSELTTRLITADRAFIAELMEKIV